MGLRRCSWRSQQTVWWRRRSTTGTSMPPGMGSGGGMDFGYGMPGSGMPIDDPSMPPM